MCWPGYMLGVARAAAGSDAFVLHDQTSNAAICNPPYAAWTRPAPDCGCSVSSRANNTNDSAPGSNHHAGRCNRSHKYAT